MGRKKGKGKGQDEKRDEEEVSGEQPSGPVEGSVASGGGKKSKRKNKKGFDDYDEELASIAAESGIAVGGNEESQGEKPSAVEPDQQEQTEIAPKTGGKKGKKKKKHLDDEELEAELREIEDGPSGSGTMEEPPAAEGEQAAGEGDSPQPDQPEQTEAAPKPGGKKGKKKKKHLDDEELEAEVREIEGGASGNDVMEISPAKDEGEPPKQEAAATEEVSTVKTAAQKKAEKKEREKKKKEAARQARLAQEAKTSGKEQPAANVSSKDETATDKEEPIATTPGKVEPSVAEETTTKEGEKKDGEQASSVATEEGAEGGGTEEGEEVKKKKKKKKKAAAVEDEKKTRGKGAPSKAMLSHIKKVKQALEEEQRKREEEALRAQREEEERERQRLEKLRLEQERKDRQKEKEKERKLRRKLEGKPVTKKEREAEARRQAALSALREKGVVVPQKHGGAEGEGSSTKGKVLYGARVRKRGKGPANASLEKDTVSSVPEAEDPQQPERDQGVDDDQVKDNWDDEEQEEEPMAVDDVKENWDDEDEEEVEEIQKEGDATTPPVATETSKGTEPEPMELESGSSSEEEGESEESSSSSSEDEGDLTPMEKARIRIKKRRVRNEAERSLDTLRSPVVCVLGHVDTGKTKILDKIRRTNVQDGEAGGITQQIGATFVPEEAIRDQTKMLKEFSKSEVKVPGLLIIDTPGHESFSNLRSRGSSLCDLAILVVDIMHGLEAQTLESLGLLRKRGTPFVVALNKIDRLYDWHRNPGAGVKDTLKRQKPNTKDDFEDRVKQTITEFAEQGLNVALFWEKVDFSEYIPLVPTSAITGDGMGDLIALLVTYSQKVIAPKLMLSMELEAVVMEVKVIAGLGTTVDVILRNGVLREGDTLVLTGNEGPFVTTVRALLMPQPLRELRVKNAYVSHKAVIASQGVKLTAKGELDKTLAGTPVFVARKPDEIDVLKEEASKVMKNVLSSIKLNDRGVYVQASTLGSLEALLEFLKVSKIPYSGVSIGPVHKKDVMRSSVMLEHDSQWAVILAFDVRVEREAQEMADGLGVRIFSADIIYHLFDAFLKHRQELRERKRKEFEHVAVFPCKLRVLPNCIFNTRDPIVVGVVVEAGIIKKGAPLTVPSKNFVDIGVVSSLELNHKPVDKATAGMEVCIKVESTGGEAPRLYGRHFDYTDMLVSKITRESIDAVKNYFREDLQKSDWQLMIELKKTFQII